MTDDTKLIDADHNQIANQLSWLAWVARRDGDKKLEKLEAALKPLMEIRD